MKNTYLTTLVSLLSPVLLLTTLSACTSEAEPVAAQSFPAEAAQVVQYNLVSEQDPDRPYTQVQQMPEYKGGDKALYTFLSQHMQYPAAAKEAGVTGVSVLQFVVERDGTVSGIHTIRSLSPETDQEAQRVLKRMSGNWIPGVQDGKPVRVLMTLPIAFTRSR